jgi:DNA-directed RNA polymerase subunit RPC12/RpoP
MNMMTKIKVNCMDCGRPFLILASASLRKRCVECEIVRLEEQRDGTRVPPNIANQVISMFRNAQARGRIPES